MVSKDIAMERDRELDRDGCLIASASANDSTVILTESHSETGHQALGIDHATHHFMVSSTDLRMPRVAGDASGQYGVLTLVAVAREAQSALPAILEEAEAHARRLGKVLRPPEVTPLRLSLAVPGDRPPSLQVAFELGQGDYLLGRAAECYPRFDCPGVSRHHAILEVLPTHGFLLRDLGSTNGTRVDGHRIREIASDSEVLVDLGPLRFLLRCERFD